MTPISTKTNAKFEVKGLNHVALVVKDMRATVDFYEGVLGMPLIKTCDLPGGMGQHFFFDMGGASIAFFWFPDAPEVDAGITVPKTLMGEMGDVSTAIGSLNHFAFNVDADKIADYKRKLEAAGVKVSPIITHDDSPMGFGINAETQHPTNWCKSIYFHDPDGIQLEFAGWTRVLGEAGDVAHEACTPADRDRYLAMRPPAAAAA